MIATAGTNGILSIWSFESCSNICTTIGHVGTIWYVIFSPDDKQIFTIGEDGCISIWFVFKEDK